MLFSILFCYIINLCYDIVVVEFIDSRWKMSIHKVLIANRGEIACRIIRSCQSKGIKTVAIYSEADQAMPYVRMADEAFCIGAPPVAQSYLNINAILEVAQITQADTIHPGYGLLSENPTFAKSVLNQGLIWIGPAPEVIASMGEKVMARKTMMMANIPIVPGTDQIANAQEAKVEAEKIGYPVMIKASAGGGGIGMHVCYHSDQIDQIFSSIQGKAKAYFGNGTLFIEKYIYKVIFPFFFLTLKFISFFTLKTLFFARLLTVFLLLKPFFSHTS